MTRQISLGPLKIGGGAPIAVQTMLNTDTRQVDETVAQLKSVIRWGAEAVRVAILDERAAAALKEITAESSVPIIADIHFDWRLALASLKSGVLGLRLNPGNIGSPDKVLKVAEAAGQAGAVIRVGVNAGSLEKEILAKYGAPTAAALVESALGQVALLENCGFSNIKVSLKASNVLASVEAARLWAQKSPWPQHVGITEAGDLLAGTVKSSVGLGLMLYEGLGDTLRVSLSAPPEEEVKVAWEILRALGLRARGIEFISCPTCGRCRIDLFSLLKDVKERLGDIEKPLKVAVMGCVVNGPGEAKEADIGIAGGEGQGIIFAHGKTQGKYPYDKLAETLEVLVRKML